MEIQSVFPDQNPIDRTTMNAWDDPRVVSRINSYGKGKIVIAGMLLLGSTEVLTDWELFILMRCLGFNTEEKGLMILLKTIISFVLKKFFGYK
ncbi:hypothetical protein [Neobacillus mesonae]|uniref:hypothetical protein n=1 Tax=Neobacillus mesonae TaxID=1193713 RepID=UPI002572C96C|nr:hypothetical protein [Neobacillus mesonae]